MTDLRTQIQIAGRRGKNRLPGRQPEPTALAREYFGIIEQMLEEQEAITKEIIGAALEKAKTEATLQYTADGWMDGLVADFATLKALREGIKARALRRVAEIGEKLGAFSQMVFKQSMRATLGIDVFLREPWLADKIKAWSTQNAELISSVSDDEQAKIARIVMEGVRGGRLVTDIQADVQNTFNVSAARAKTIARTETAKLNSELSETRQREVGIKTYYWQTSDDERVRGNPSGKFPKARPRHDVLDGMLCRWDDPAVYSDDNGENWKRRSSIGGYEGNPGTDFSCRCVSRANTEELLQSLGI